MRGIGWRRLCLQWGRGHLTAERALSHLLVRPGQLPSMGPRSFDRGEEAHIPWNASDEENLQWGRGHLTAERHLDAVHLRV